MVAVLKTVKDSVCCWLKEKGANSIFKVSRGYQTCLLVAVGREGVMAKKWQNKLMASYLVSQGI